MGDLQAALTCSRDDKKALVETLVERDTSTTELLEELALKDQRLREAQSKHNAQQAMIDTAMQSREDLDVKLAALGGDGGGESA